MICDGFYFLKFEISLKIRRDIILCSSKLRIVCNIDSMVKNRFVNSSGRKDMPGYYFDVAHYPPLQTAKCDISAIF